MKKKKNLNQLQAELRFAFHRYVRLRDLLKGCISCGNVLPFGPDWQAGHYHSCGSSYEALKYDEENTNGQCRTCNNSPGGNKPGQHGSLITRYGTEVFSRFMAKSVAAQNDPMTHLDYEYLIDRYTGLFKALENQYGINPTRTKRYHKKKVPVRPSPDWKDRYRKSKNWKPAVINMDEA